MKGKEEMKKRSSKSNAKKIVDAVEKKVMNINLTPNEVKYISPVHNIDINQKIKTKPGTTRAYVQYLIARYGEKKVPEREYSSLIGSKLLNLAKAKFDNPAKRSKNILARYNSIMCEVKRLNRIGGMHRTSKEIAKLAEFTKPELAILDK